MKKLALALLLLLPGTVFAASAKPNPADFTLTVHVLSSSIVGTGSGVLSQVLETSIDNQSVELTHSNSWQGVLSPGDYKAHVSTSVHAPRYDNNTYEVYRGYDLLLPDGTTRTYTVTALSLPSTNP